MQHPVQTHEAYPHVVKNRLTLVKPSSELSANQTDKALSLIMRDSYYSQTVATLTTGVFLVGFALQFKAPNFVVGLLAAVPFLAQLVQLPAIYLVEKLRSRRRITVLATLISRLFLLPMALAPFLPSQRLSLTLLIACFIGHTGIGAIATCAWNSWLKDVVPARELGAFFSGKLFLSTLITILLTLLGGCFITTWASLTGVKVFGYSLLFGVALAAGLLGIPLLRDIPEPGMKSEEPSLSKSGMLARLLEPLQDENFRRLISFMMSWNFAVNLAAPFLTVYMLTLLDFPMAMVTLMTIVGQIANLLFLKVWGKLADRFSNKSVLLICAPLFIFCILGWTFTTLPEKHALTVPLVTCLQILMGIATAGVTLANGNIVMKLAPEDKGTTYLATNSIAASLAAGTAPILGGLFADFFARQELSLVLHWQASENALNLKTLDLHSWDFFFGLAFLIGLVAICRLKSVQETGHTGRRAVLIELVAEAAGSVKTMTAAGKTTVSCFGNILRTVTAQPIKTARQAASRACSLIF